MALTRLDLFILRTTAQRVCTTPSPRGQGHDGQVLELGLGNGAYDHLRARFPGRAIHVFDREVAAHPDCIPPSGCMHLGDFRQTVPAFAAAHPGKAWFVHADGQRRPGGVVEAGDGSGAGAGQSLVPGATSRDQAIVHPALSAAHRFLAATMGLLPPVPGCWNA